MLKSPSTLLALTALGQLLCRTHRAPQLGRWERRLEEAVFAQSLELLLSNKPKLKEQDPDPSGACSPCVCACRSPERSARGQSLGLLKSIKVGMMMSQ